MVGKKSLAEIRAERAALLGRLPGQSPRRWLQKEIASAKGKQDRDVETLCAALEHEAARGKKPKRQRRPARG